MCKFNKPYAEALREGLIQVDEIDDYVEYWHKHDTGNSLEEFLGMTKTEMVQWIKNGNNYLPAILGIEMEPPKMPVCKMCNRELGVRLPDGSIICKSDYIEDNDYCFECQIEHCLQTNCLGCEIGKYPDCRFLDMKKSYMEDIALENKEEGEQA